MHMRNARCPARQFIDNEVAKLLQKEVIRLSEPEAEGQVISPISVREKKGGSHRIILNLKALNDKVEYQTFKMETAQFGIPLCHSEP